MAEKQKTEVECKYWERKMAQRKKFYLEMEAEVLDGSEMKMEDLRVSPHTLLSEHNAHAYSADRKQSDSRVTCEEASDSSP